MATYEWGADVLVAQGESRTRSKVETVCLVPLLLEFHAHAVPGTDENFTLSGIESGGHGHSKAPPLLALLPEILDALQHQNRRDSDGATLRQCPPLLAAGGVATGKQAASLLTLGAAGVVLGTRFLLTPEATYSQAQKNALLAATDASATVRTVLFDQLRGTIGWPAGVDGRALSNESIRRANNGESVADLQSFFDKSTRDGDAAGMLVWSGTGVGLMREIKPAAVSCKDLRLTPHILIASYRI